MKNKLPFVSLCAFALCLMISCSPNDDNKKVISVTGGEINQTVYADENLVTNAVTFETVGAWTSHITENSATRTDKINRSKITRADDVWIRITPASGNTAGSYTISIILSDNYTGSDRTATITFSCNGESITITITQKGTTENGQIPVEEVKVSGLNLSHNELVLTVDESETLIAIVLPADATNKNVSWSSNNTNVITVDANGKVTAVSPGTAAVIATTVDGGKTAICNITVNTAIVSVSGVSLNKSEIILTVGNAETLIATILPADATNKNVSWSSNDTNIATVDANGKVTAVSPGATTITVITIDGSKAATCNVTVQAAPVGPGGGSEDWGNGGKINL